MATIKEKEQFTFNDILLEPAYSNVVSRNDVKLSVKLCKGFEFETPIIPANMKSVVSNDLVNFMFNKKGLSLLHRFYETNDEYLGTYAKLVSGNEDMRNYLGVSLGVKEYDKQLASKFAEMGCRIFCVDIAHCNSKQGVEMTSYLAKTYPNNLLIAGNIATGDAAERLWKAGADVVKIGIGSGAICSTRTTAGAGVPQLSAIMDVAEKQKFFKNKNKFSISDGGIRLVGDLSKALAFTDMVMVGSMMSALDESPGETVELNGTKYKHYDGSSTYRKEYVEGVKGLKELKGSAQDQLTKLHQGLQSGCSYAGASNLQELKELAIFNKISLNSLGESMPHDIIINEKI